LKHPTYKGVFFKKDESVQNSVNLLIQLMSEKYFVGNIPIYHSPDLVN